MVSHYESSPEFTPVAVYGSYLNLLSGNGEINQVLAVFGEEKKSIFDALGASGSKKWTLSQYQTPRSMRGERQRSSLPIATGRQAEQACSSRPGLEGCLKD